MGQKAHTWGKKPMGWAFCPHQDWAFCPMCDFFIKSLIFHVNSFTHASLLCYSEKGILVHVLTHYKVKY